MSDTSTSQYDLPVMIGSAIVGIITVGIFYYMYSQRDIPSPAPPAEPVTAPLNAQAAPVVMVETSGSGKGGNQQQGGGIDLGGGGGAAGKFGGGPGRN